MKIFKNNFMMAVLFVMGCVGLFGCMVNNGITKGFLSFPYAIMIAVSVIFYKKGNRSSFYWLAIGLYVVSIVANPFLNKLMEGTVNQEEYQLVFIEDSYLVKIGNQHEIDILTKNTLNNMDRLFKVKHEVIHTFPAGSKFSHNFKRDLSSWLDGDLYTVDLSSYIPEKTEVDINHNRLTLGSKSFENEKIWELYKNDHPYKRNYAFYLSQSANWPVIAFLIVGAIFESGSIFSGFGS